MQNDNMEIVECIHTTGPWHLQVNQEDDLLIVARHHQPKDKAAKALENVGGIVAGHDAIFTFVRECFENKVSVYKFIQGLKESKKE